MYKHPKREEKKKWMCIAQKIFFGLCWLCFIFHENTQGHLRPAVCSWEGENKLPKCFFIWNSQIARLPSPLFLAFGSTFACHPAPFPASYIVTDSPQMFLVRRGKKQNNRYHYCFGDWKNTELIALIILRRHSTSQATTLLKWKLNYCVLSCKVWLQF